MKPTFLRIANFTVAFALLVTLVIRSAPAQEKPATSPAGLAAVVGKPLKIEGKTLDGKEFNSDAWKGKVVLVDFWATWCGPCVAAMPHLKKLHDANHDKGFEIVGVSNDFSAAGVTRFLGANPAYTWTQLFDPDAAKEQEFHPSAKKLGIDALPATVLIDKKGVVHAVNLSADALDEAVKKLLAD